MFLRDRTVEMEQEQNGQTLLSVERYHTGVAVGCRGIACSVDKIEDYRSAIGDGVAYIVEYAVENIAGVFVLAAVGKVALNFGYDYGFLFDEKTVERCEFSYRGHLTLCMAIRWL